MTREEAIELLDVLPLCNECDSNNFPYTCVECGDAFQLAMEALKQPEIVRCKDCVNLINDPNDIPYCRWHRGLQFYGGDWFCADGRKRNEEES